MNDLREKLDMYRSDVYECCISINRLILVINRDDDWSKNDLIEELECAKEWLEKAGYKMKGDDLFLRAKESMR